METEIPEANAARIEALRASAGAGGEQDWDSALDHLRRAAKLGSRLALAELTALAEDWEMAYRLLAGETVPTAHPDLIAGRIDMTRWLELPRYTTISEHPRVVAVGDMAGPELCQWVIARSRGKLSRAPTGDRRTGERDIFSTARTNSHCDFRGAEADLVVATLRARMAAVTGTQLVGFESVHVFQYAAGQEFQPHLDATLDSRAADYPAQYAAGRQRVLTFLLALNDDFEGGETEFPTVGLRWKPRRGRGLFFWNVESDGSVDRGSFHAGRPVVRGEKWMLSQWIAGRRPADG